MTCDDSKVIEIEDKLTFFTLDSKKNLIFGSRIGNCYNVSFKNKKLISKIVIAPNLISLIVLKNDKIVTSHSDNIIRIINNKDQSILETTESKVASIKDNWDAEEDDNVKDAWDEEEEETTPPPTKSEPS